MFDYARNFHTRLRSSSEPIPSPYVVGNEQVVSPRSAGTSAVQTGSVSSPRNLPVQNRCGTCVGCMEDGLCYYRMANLALSPPIHNQPPSTMSRGGEPPRQMNYYTHPTSPHTPHRAAHPSFAYQRNVNPQATSSTPNLPIHLAHEQPGRVSPSAISQTSSRSTTPPQIFSPSTSPPLVFSPSGTFSPSIANLTLRTGDKCHVRSSSNTWHRYALCFHPTPIIPFSLLPLFLSLVS